MMRSDRIQISSELQGLAGWFARCARILPWRDDPRPYRVWVSEIMLQQTQVTAVTPFFERFVLRFPTVEALAAASIEDVTLAWAGLGYYSRARNLHAAAQAVVCAGEFPKDRDGWEALPGVGPYTAGAVLSIAYGKPEAIVDGNVERVFARYYQIKRGQSESAYKSILWDHAREWVLRAYAKGISPSVTNQALMELGATLCTPRAPKCELCPIANKCQARSAREQLNYPERKRPKQWVQVSEQCVCVVNARGQVLVRQRRPNEWRAGLWDLPFEDDSVAMQGLERVGEIESRHIVTRHKIIRRTHVFRAPEAWAASGPNPSDKGFAWLDPSTPELATPRAFSKTLQLVMERFGSTSGAL